MSIANGAHIDERLMRNQATLSRFGGSMRITNDKGQRDKIAIFAEFLFLTTFSAPPPETRLHRHFY